MSVLHDRFVRELKLRNLSENTNPERVLSPTTAKRVSF